MRYLISLSLIIILLASCNKKTNVPREILVAEDSFDEFVNYKLDFKLFSDSTYIFNYHENEWAHEKNEMFRGRYFMNSDTINFSPSKFEFIYSDKAIIKEGFIEFLNGERPLKIKIKKTILDTKLAFDTVKFNDYAFFSYDSNYYKCFSGNAKSIDLNNKDLIKLDSLLTTCMDQNSKLITLKSTDYYKQCIAIIDSNGEKIVWINLLCKGKRFSEDFKYSVSHVNDGGDCFANLKVNLTRLTFYELRVNGSV